jgi:uncharacterized protein (TIGR02118 family)
MVGRIKLFGLGVRRPGLSPEDFHDHWRHPHGTWARMMTTLRGYVQSHQIHSELLSADQSRYEMIAEMWVDNLKDLREFRQEPILVKHLVPDEENFLDLANSVFFATEEEVVIACAQGEERGPGDELWSESVRPISIKLLQFVGQGCQSDEEWSIDQALACSIGAVRYVRCRPLQAFYESDPPFAGVHELWWPTLRAFQRGVVNAPDAWTSLRATRASSITVLVQAERLL